MEEEYMKYLIKFHKNINRALDKNRINAFNKHFIQLHNMKLYQKSNDYTFHIDYNEFFDYTDEEIKLLTNSYQNVNYHNYYNNQNKVNKNNNHNILKYNDKVTSNNNNKYTDYNWDSNNNLLGYPVYTVRNKDLTLCDKQINPIRNQGLCGSCWAFTTTAAVEANLMINMNINILLSAQELIDCDRQNNRGCSGGNPIYAYEYVIKNGLSTAINYPYIGMVILIIKYYLNIKTNSLIELLNY